ncbi:DUF763 domain-containing protein [Candidatus Desantisbacteria bacterium]|nr:DUF763 domain-containing protein [Candidatus Desantisbacteria bacterium]
MTKTGTANLPLHYGNAPAWLFTKMRALSREIITLIVSDFGPEEFLKRMSDPFWFQAFGCVLGFDWHSSGLTTTVCGAIKESIRGIEKELGVFVAGGKGKTSRKTPSEIELWSEKLSINPLKLVYASRMSAKVDNSAVQDGYQLYHHTFLFTKKGNWAVVQQGMNDINKWARRYHWFSEDVLDFVCEPHSAICSDKRGETLNMVAKKSEEARIISTDAAKENPEKLAKEIDKIINLELPGRHPILQKDINSKYLQKIFLTTYEKQPENFEDLLGIEGVGPKTIRALALISEIIYGKSPSFEDPARYSFAHGGKDGFPYPVDRKNYDNSIEYLRKAITLAKIGQSDKIHALKRLGNI